jgi:hypothetical protein
MLTSPEVQIRCRLCSCKLVAEEGDDFEKQVCGSCESRPEARKLGKPLTLVPSGTSSGRTPARAFTAAEKSLARKLISYLPAAEVLSVLNERLSCDLGPDAAPYTMDQLKTELDDGTAMESGNDWASLRKMLAKARREGILERIDEQLIDDFAVVYSLNPKQVLSIKEIILDSQEDA